MRYVEKENQTIYSYYSYSEQRGETLVDGYIVDYLTKKNPLVVSTTTGISRCFGEFKRWIVVGVISKHPLAHSKAIRQYKEAGGEI